MSVWVRGIEWSCEFAREALLQLTDGEFVIDGIYNQPCELQIGDAIALPLHALSSSHVMRTDERASWTRLEPGTLQHESCATVVDVEKRLVAIGKIEIELEEMPKDLRVGEQVHFYCGRLDGWGAPSQTTTS